MNRRHFIHSVAILGGALTLTSGRTLAVSSQNLSPPMQEASLWATGIDEADTSRLRIGIVATGGGACNTLASHIGEFPGLTRMIAIDTSEITLRKLPNATHIQLRDNGRFSGNPLAVSDLAKAARPVIAQALVGLDFVFILASTAGSSIAPMIAKIASESGINTVGAVIAPFGWEGEARLASALRQYGVKTLFSLANEESARRLAPHISPQSVFDIAAQNFDALYRGIVIPLVEPGIIGIELADVLDVLNQPGVSSCGHGIAIGPGAAATACSQAIERSWLGQGRLNAASRILVHIEGEETLTMSDYGAVCEQLQLHCLDAVVVVSLRLSNAPGTGCRVTLLATGAGFEMPA
jgi:cell division GTPase FtsZ